MRSVDMPTLAKLRNVSSYSRLVRYGNSFHSSRRYLTREGNCVILKKRSFGRSFGTLQQTFDRNLLVFIEETRNYGRLAVHVNKTRNMSSEQGDTRFDSSQKENDDLSLPFWIFVWSFLAIFAGFIYSKLNKQGEDDSEQKSEVQLTTNDEQIARKLVNEISKKDSGRKPFKRQRSYEIIDGEVRIHYDVTMLEDSFHKRANTERILDLAEVESMPIRRTSLDDLEFVYPGSLPRIVEEGEEELLGDQNEERTPLIDRRVYINEGKPEVNQLMQETKGKRTQINTAKILNQENSDKNADKFEDKGLHSEREMDNFIVPTFETVTQETLLIPAESINNANKIPICLQKDSDTELINKRKRNLVELNNEMVVSENSSGRNELRSTLRPTSTNSLNNSSTSVYKLTEVQKTQEHEYTVTRREVTRLKSSEECLGESEPFKVETGFPLVEAEGIQETAVNDGLINGSQKSLENDCSISHPDMQVTTESQLNSDENVEFLEPPLFEEELKGRIDNKLKTKEVAENKAENVELHETSDARYYSNENLEQQELNNFSPESPEHERIASECQDLSLGEPGVLTSINEGSDVLVDSSGDILFKVTGSSDGECLEGIVEYDKVICKKKSDQDLDENENYGRFGTKNDLTNNWRSLSSWESVHDSELESTKIGNCDDKNMAGLQDDKTLGNSRVEGKYLVNIDNFSQVENNNLERIFNGKTDNVLDAEDVDLKYSHIQKNLDTNVPFQIQNDNKLIISEAGLPMVDNKIGSRKTIFVKGNLNSEHKPGAFMETSLDDSKNAMTTAGFEQAAMLGTAQNENNRPESFESETSGEIVNPHTFKVNEVDEECSAPGQDDQPENVDMFTRADLVEEDVLVAKIVTVQIPDVENVDLLSSCKSKVDSTVKTFNTKSQEAVKEVFSQNDPAFANSDLIEESPAEACLQEENVLVAKIITFEESGPDIHLASLETISQIDNEVSPDLKRKVSSNIDSSATQKSLVITDVFKPKTIITSTTTKTSRTEVTCTNVISMAKKMDENLGHHLQIVNDHNDLSCDIHEPTILKQTIDGEVEGQFGESYLGRNLDNNFVQSVETNDKHTSEQISITSATENKEITASEINGINDDRQFSSETLLSVVDKDQQAMPSHNPDIDLIGDLPTNTSSMESDKEIDKIEEIDPHSNNYSSSKEPVNYSEMKSSLVTDNIGESIQENQEVVLYDNQATELKPSTSDSFGKEHEIDDTAELIDSRTVDEVIVPRDLTEVISKADENVIYAKQISEMEEFADTLIADNCSNQASDCRRNTSGKNNRGSRVTTVAYASQVCKSEMNEESHCETENQLKQTADGDLRKVDKNKSRTTVTYSKRFNETKEIQEIVENTCPADTKNISPNNSTEYDQNTSIDSSVLPQLKNEGSTFLETSLDTPSPVGIVIPREQQDDVVGFDKKHAMRDPAQDKVSSDVQESELLLISTNEPNKTSSESRPNVPHSETDVDCFSDIDEIDIDVLPEEKCRKSKSVTDLDEALASFKGLVYLPSDNDNITVGLSKSVPDIVDICREESLKGTLGNSENLQKKTLSLSTPEITCKTESGSKKVTKIKIVHVKFLEMQDEGEGIEEDSFIYEGELPITGKMKRRSRNLSDEMSSPVASPPPGVSHEIAQERWIAEKTNLKQLEFEFGDLFQNSPSPSPPPFEPNESSIDGHNQAPNKEKIMHVPKFTNYSIVRDFDEEKSSSEAGGRVSNTNDNHRSLLAETNNTTFRTDTTDNSKFETKDQRATTKQTAPPTITYYETPDAASYCNVSKDKPLHIEKPSEEIISARPVVAKSTTTTKTTNQTSRLHRSSASTSRQTKVIHKNDTQVGSVINESERHEKISRITDLSSGTRSTVEYRDIKDTRLPISSGNTSQPSTDSMSYRYIPGNANSYSNVPKPVPEHAKYVVKSTVIAAQSPIKQSSKGNVTSQARYSDSSPRHVTQYTDNTNSSRNTRVRYAGSPNSSSSLDSPRHGLKLSEKFRISEEGDLGRKSEAVPNFDGSRLAGSKTDTNQRTDDPKTKKSNHRGSYTKVTSQHGGRLVTVKGGIISDYECSSDADSEMSYNVPSPRVKAKRFHRPQVQRVDSASSSEPDSPRRGVIKDERRRMSELFGVDEVAYSSDVSKDGKDQNLPSRKTRRNETSLEANQTSSNVYQAKATIYDQRQQGVRNFNTAYDMRSTPHHQHYTNNLERNLSPTSFLREGNLSLDDQTSSKTIEFNPFEDLEDRDISQPRERCHSPSSVYSDTSSVFSFNCDFDPMPPPTGRFEPEVYTCENPMCRKQDILLGQEKTSFKSCPACFTYYCSSECRKLHWPSHKQSCYFGRVNTYVRSIIRLCQRREDLSMYLSQLARDAYKKKGRGVVMAIFNSPELAREFITKGHDAFSGRKPTYSSLAELNREGIISKHRVALMQAVRDYEPNEEFVFNIAVVATNSIPIAPTPRYKLNTVLHCIKMPLNHLIVAKQPKDYEKIETRLFALPRCSRHEFINEMEARRHYCRNLSKNLRQYNVKLKDDYPECYKKLCMYVEHNISFEPMVVYGQRSGLGYKCVIAPEQSYPLNAEYC